MTERTDASQKVQQLLDELAKRQADARNLRGALIAKLMSPTGPRPTLDEVWHHEVAERMARAQLVELDEYLRQHFGLPD